MSVPMAHKISNTEDLVDAIGIEAAGTDAAPKPGLLNGLKIGSSDYTNDELNTALGGGAPATAGTITASKPVIVDANKKVDGGFISRMVHSNTAASTENAATSLTAFSNGTKTLPVLAAGDVVRASGLVSVTTLGSATSTNDTLQITVTLGGQTILDTTAVADAILNDHIAFDVTAVIRTVHASTGTAYTFGTMSGQIGAAAFTGDVYHGAIGSLASAAAMDLVVKAAFGNAANKTTLQSFVVQVN